MKKSDVIKYFRCPTCNAGNEATVARALNISRQAVYKWGEVIPEAVAWRIQALTKSRLKVDPQVYDDLRGKRKAG